MKVEAAPSPVFEKALQCEIHRAKCNFRPRNIVFRHQYRFKGFVTGLESKVKQTGTVDDVDLADVGKIYKGEHGAQSDSGACFFKRLPERGVPACFVVFHESGGESPVPVAGLNGSSAHEDAVFPFDQSADDYLGVLVVNGAALVANMAGQAVSGGNSKTDWRAAIGAVVHGWGKGVEVYRF